MAHSAIYCTNRGRGAACEPLARFKFPSVGRLVPWLCQYVIEAPPPDTCTLATAGNAESGANLGVLVRLLPASPAPGRPLYLNQRRSILERPNTALLGAIDPETSAGSLQRARPFFCALLLLATRMR